MAWELVISEAKKILDLDPFMEDILKPFILDHRTFGNAMTKLLAAEFAGYISAEKWHILFETAFSEQIYDPLNQLNLETMGLLDLLAIRDRDPASDGLVNPFLHFKGFKAIQAHRIAHVLWRTGRKDTARCIQSRCSELYAIDIHPAARIGEGLMIDHGTGVVIGETAIIGRNCTFLHGVTLGSTGKDSGDRHPKIGHDVLIGCNATLLGNINIGHCCKIGSGSMVLKDLPPFSTAVGNPAKVVGKSLCPSASEGMDTALRYVVTSAGNTYESTLTEDEMEREFLNYMI
jgi:serine O-acetyltransferase